MLTFLSLAVGTLVSEDLACIAAGLLIQRGDISRASGVVACAFGIFVGDVTLWGLGRIGGRAALAWPVVARHLDRDRIDALSSWLDRHAGQAIVTSRFLPGTRLPLYVIAGFIGLSGRVFAQWALLAAALWTPALVLLTATFGEAFVSRVSPLVGSAWMANVVAACFVLGVVRTFRLRRCFSGPP